MINRFMKAVLRAFSYAGIDVKAHYKAERLFINFFRPPMKILYKIWDHKISVGDALLPVRVFTPKIQTSNDILLFFHGGGWVTGNIDSYTKTCGLLSNQTGRRVFSLDYRLAPEFPFPCAVSDCYAAAKEICLNKSVLLNDCGEIILIGDSAGGNLAASVSLMAAQKKEFQIHKQILLYPLTYNDHSETSPFPSVIQNGKGYLLTARRIIEYTELYVQNHIERNNPYFAPLLSNDLKNQPKTLIITAEFDPLRDEGEAYGLKLRNFGNDVSIYRMPDALHGFFTLPLFFKHVKKCYKLINSFLNEVMPLEK